MNAFKAYRYYIALKLHFTKEVDEELISQLIASACNSAIPTFEYIYKTFATKQ
mgnify:CR=1 FL=1